MKKKILLSLIVISVAILKSSLLIATNTGASFLKIGVGARPLGMGGGYIAIADDLNAIYWNPGGLAQLKQREFSAMHAEWIDDLKYEFLGYAHPLKKSTLGASLVYLRMGEMEKRDENRKLLNKKFTAYDFAGTISYSQFISQKSSIGVNLKIVHQTIEEETANSFAFDLGLLQKTEVKNLNLGLTIQNIGPKMKFIKEVFNLPLTVSAGVAYKVYGVCNFGLNATRRVFEKKTEFGFGTEYWLANVIALRGRYTLSKPNNQSPNNQFSKLGGGLGFKISNYQVDYSFLPYTDLGNTHRVSFSAKF